MNLKGELHNIREGFETVDVYLQKIKVVRDKLMAVGVHLDDEELSHIAIKGLPKEYSAFSSAIRTRNTTLTFDELATTLGAEEESLHDSFESERNICYVTLQDLQIIPIIISSLMVIEVVEKVPAMAKEVVVGTFLIQVHNVRTSHKASNS